MKLERLAALQTCVGRRHFFAREWLFFYHTLPAFDYPRCYNSLFHFRLAAVRELQGAEKRIVL